MQLFDVILTLSIILASALKFGDRGVSVRLVG